MAVLLFDAPLLHILLKVHGGPDLLYSVGDTRAYVWFVSVAGTFMYAAVGFVLGLLLRLVHRRREMDDED